MLRGKHQPPKPLNMTGTELYKVCKTHKYFLLRYDTGYLMGINTKVADIRLKKNDIDLSKETKIKGFIPCNFNTYINYKHPFIIT